MRLLEDTSGVFYFEGAWHLARDVMTIRSQVHTWMVEHMGTRGFYDANLGIVPLDRRWAVVSGTTTTDKPPTFYFRNKVDAILFKLTWAGTNASY